MVPARYRLLTTGKASRSATQASIRFLLELWDYDADAYTFIGTRRGERWRDHPIKGDREAQIAAILTGHPADRFDLYFCPNAFAQPQRKTLHALPSRYAWCDIDDADPDGYDPRPNILWETSPRRFQGLWLWRKSADGHIAEQYSKNIWVKDGGDKGGWSITKMLRLPGSTNHKPVYAKPVVTLRAYDSRPQRLPASIRTVVTPNTPPTASMVEPINGNAASIMRRYRIRMGLEAGTLMTAKRVMRGDRSGAVFLIAAKMIEVGASDDEIACVLLANPYFVDKWGNDSGKAQDQIAQVHARKGAGR